MLLNSNSRLTRRRGAVVVLAAVTLVAIISVVALSLDGGGLMAERRQAQATADAAAMAAACELYHLYWTNNGQDLGGTAKESALATAKANGYDDATAIAIVDVQIPPKTGYYVDRRGYVEVVVEYKQKRNFSSIFGASEIPVKARATALGSPIAADVGILVLHPTDKAAFSSQGGGGVVVKGTPIVVNSKNAEGSIAGGGGAVKADKFVLSGGYATKGNGSFDGKIRTNAPPMIDPLLDLPVPVKADLVPRADKKTQYTSGTNTLKPGVYKGGINVSGTGNLVLEPGVYYMDGGGFGFSGQGSLEGKGVMIYNDPGNGNSGGISVTGQGSMILYGPPTGVYQGVTFFQRRDSTVTGNVSGTGGKTDITGTFYFPGALLSVSGNGGVANIGSQYISNKLSLGGTGAINIDWQPDKVARKRSIHLVE